MSDKIMQSYVWHEEKCFFVSTINRESSAALAYEHIYAETMVWDYDYDKRERGSLVWQGEDIKGGISTHLLACKNLHEFGAIRDDEDA